MIYNLTEQQYHSWKTIAAQYCKDLNIYHGTFPEDIEFFLKNKYNITYVSDNVKILRNGNYGYIDFNNEKQITMLLLSL